MPFGHDCEFADMEACMKAHADKDDPQAFCAALMHDTEEMCKSRSRCRGIERRFSAAQRPAVATRVDGKRTITGYAAVYYDGSPGSQFDLFGDGSILERIMPGAFDQAVRNDDVRALVNHNPDAILGRTSAKTLTLASDGRGLRYEVALPDTQAARDVTVSIERGDITGSSFAFMPRKTAWVEEEDRLIRELHDVEVFDVSPVTFPAYSGASVGLRAGDLADLKAEAEKFRASRAAARLTPFLAGVRARAVQILEEIA